MFTIWFAPSLFQQIMDTMLAGLNFVIGYLDDKSDNFQEHYVREVFKRIQEYGFKLGLEKMGILHEQDKIPWSDN